MARFENLAKFEILSYEPNLLNFDKFRQISPCNSINSPNFPAINLTNFKFHPKLRSLIY
ncbi:hypothetical protein [Campylobacter sp. JMF_08 NE1]|uniref:hypothetical protein n=1 Tax=Campylobacter sp. JMF_08 NE1 TaxID=2983821 RepID=UPI0022E9D3F1|nr:hypothetical protein [Campylobacter sp. JMF_08 NE1]MDA3047672.1 hypothetical protein [Campylobacter sp. JMF_08 NE1]